MMKTNTYWTKISSACCYSFAALLFALIINTGAQAQVVKTESFDGTQYPPFGWSGGKLGGTDNNNFTERVTAGTAPVCAPQSGAGFVRYRSGFMFNAGEQYFLSSPKFDLSLNPGTATVSFWMYRDTWNTVKDSVGLYVNDSSAANLSRGSMTYIYGRSHDTTGFNGWRNYIATIPAGYVTSSVHFVFIFTNRETSGAGANIYIDNFSVQTYPKASVLISSQLIYQETADVAKGQTDQLVAGILVKVDGAGDGVTNSFRIDSIVTNATGTNNILTDVVGASAKVWSTKGTNSFVALTGVNQVGVGITPTYFRDKFVPGATMYLENGDNYFWISYSTTVGATSGNFIDADFNGIYYRRPGYGGADTSRAPLVSSLVGARQIDVSLCNGVIPTLGVGTSWLNGSYTNNDYVNRVYLRAQNAVTPSYPFIDNQWNDVGPALAPWNSGPAPFTVHPPDYQQFSQTPSAPLHNNITAVLVQGTTYTIPSLVAGNPVGQGLALMCGTWSSSNYMAAWIDFNKDGDLMDFTGAVSEKIHQSGPMNASTWTFSPVTVPNVLTAPTPNVAGPIGITYGNVKMRIREVFATSNIMPCQSGYTYGETEDYIISIIPTCPAGVKLWLGYTNDWNTPGNWCGGVPTINDVAIIDEVGYLGGTQIGAPFDPVINPGTVATAKTIRLSSTDSLIANSPSGSSLQIADSLTISYNTPAGGGGYFKVNSAFNDTAQLSNGNLGFNITPFTATRKNQRLQLIYTPNDLINKGIQAGDIIDSLYFHIKSRATSPAFAGVYNKFFITWAKVTPGFSAWPAIPASLASAGPYTVLRDSSTALSITAALGAGVGRLAVYLPNPLIWNGTDTIVLNISFNNSLVSLTGVVANDLLSQTGTTGFNRTMWINNSSTNSGNTRNWPLAGGDVAFTTQYRPNITFHFKRPYTKFPINMTGNGATTAGRWVNNGTFVAGRSIVTFSNASLNQDIGGANVTTFSELAVNKTGAIGTQRVIMGLNANVDTALVLTAGGLDLNQRTLSINNGLPSGITRTSGWILSETVPPNYGTVNWNIGANTALHSFPFGTTAGTYIPVEYTNTSANSGVVSIATYNTASNDNTPYPVSGGPYTISVLHMNAQSTGTDISITEVVDRFWMINKSVAGASNGTLKLSYRPGVPAAGEEPAGGPYVYTAQRFQLPGGLGSPLGGWANRPGANASGSVTATLVGDPISGPWTLANQANPLPVELLTFDAKLIDDKVKVYWSTASEIDNDYFTVERTRNGNDFDFIAKVNSQGPGTSTRNYETFDYEPQEGLQYYRLTTTDISGDKSFSKMVPVRIINDGIFDIDHINANYGSNALEVVFTYDSNESYTYSVVDILGRTLVTKSGNAGHPGMNTLTIPVSMNKGIYFVVIENSQKKTSSKVVY